MSPALQKAIQTIMQEIGAYEQRSMEGMRAPAHAEPDGDEGYETCAACEAGTCDNPDHMAPEEMEGVAKEYL